MADDKWITTLTPETPAADAARDVLRTRLAVVVERLAPAVGHATEDVEHVHQLRVATRRSGAALRIFADCLPDAPFDVAKKLLRGVRRAAGDARDWDVFAAAVRDTDRLAGEEYEPARAYLLGLAGGCRAAAQAKLRTAVGRYGADLAPAFETLCEHARQPPASPGLTVGGLAAAELRDLFADFNDGVADGPRSAAALHQLRIAGKRLRYAIEVFAGCLPAPLKDTYYPAVETAQELLGTVNDAHVAAARLAAIRTGLRKLTPTLTPVVRPGLDALIAGVKADAADGTKAFRKWCREWSLLLAEHPLTDVLRPAAVIAAA